jgi:hypothetical protein
VLPLRATREEVCAADIAAVRVLAGEAIKRIADECGTSTAMIHRDYLHARRAARRAIRDGQSA